MSSTSNYVGVYGLWNSFYGLWLDEAVLRETYEVVSHNERLNDKDCVLIKAQYSGLENRIWLDRAHAFLPRQVEQVAIDEDGNPGKHVITWTVNRFDEIDGQLWWPMEGRLLTLPERMEFSQWFVQKVTLNETIPRSEMAPPKGTPGITNIIDYVNSDVRKTPGAAQEAKLTPASERPASNSGGLISAVPASATWWWSLWAGVFLLAIGATVRLLRR